MPILIAGPTASGKSALAVQIAREQGGVIVNADALQVFAGWKILTARPNATELAAAPHALYGHVPYDADYSVGHWLRDVVPYLSGSERPIIVGGTGLYLTALTEGLAEIPPISNEVREQANKLEINQLLAEIDGNTAKNLDQKNRMRVQRAWEVQRATGRSLIDWQQSAAPPLLPLANAIGLVVDAPKEWLTPRIALRFDQMLAQGALAEATAMRPKWDPSLLSSNAIGAAEMVAVVDGEMTIPQAREAVVIATRRYAKRQRTWFRARMRNWMSLPISSTDLSTALHFSN